MNEHEICIGFIALSFFLSLGIESILLPKIIFISQKKNLFDFPDNRKQHIKPVSRLGGVSFLPVLLLVLMIVQYIWCKITNYDANLIRNDTLSELVMLISGLLVLFLVGIKDDLVGVRYSKKFVIQFIASTFLVLSGIYINNFYGLFGIHEVPIWIGIPFSIFLSVFITNSINLIDGIDGLASGISGAALFTYGVLFYIGHQWTYSIICFTMLGILVPFFYYNVFNNKHKIFMGDTGSLSLGFLLSFLGIRLAMNVPGMPVSSNGAILVALSALFIPLFDALKVMCIRFYARRNIFQPDRNHIHHQLIDVGIPHRITMFIIILASILLTVTNLFALEYIDINIILGVDIFIGITFCRTIMYIKARKSKKKILFTTSSKNPKGTQPISEISSSILKNVKHENKNRQSN